jgi:hypothetical protein
MKHLDEAKENKSKIKDSAKTKKPRKHTGKDSLEMVDNSASIKTIPDPIDEIYLAPASKKNSPSPAFDRFSKTVLNEVDQSKFSSNHIINSTRFWGFQPGGRLESTWKKMPNNSYILFYTGWGLYTLGVRLVGKKEDRELAKELWPDYRDTSGGTDNENKQPYQYLLYLADPLPINLPAKVLHSYLGYKNDYVSGFIKADRQGISKIVSEHGSFRNFLKEYIS